jgi:hypothetical protein
LIFPGGTTRQLGRPSLRHPAHQKGKKEQIKTGFKERLRNEYSNKKGRQGKGYGEKYLRKRKEFKNKCLIQ